MRYLSLFLSSLVPLFGDLIFHDKIGTEIRLIVAKSSEALDLSKGKEILVTSFMKAYEDVPLEELNPSFKCIGDVRRFYENYFDSELAHFNHGGLFWIQGFTWRE